MTPVGANREGGMSPDIVYLRNSRHPEGAFMPRSEAWISPNDRGFVFGDGVYEVVRAYGGQLFMLDDHISRLQRGLQATGMPALQLPQLRLDMQELLERNGLARGDAMVYVQVTRGEAPRAHPFPSPPVPPTVYMAISPAPDYARVQKEGVRVVTLSDFRWSRCDIKTVALQGNVLSLQHARERGAEECVFVRDGMLTEGSHSNFFAVLDRVVRTHPATNHILAGVTRRCVIDICCEADILWTEREIPETEVPRLEEAFLTATSYEVTPIVAINGMPVGDGKPGPITRRIQKRFRSRTKAG